MADLPSGRLADIILFSRSVLVERTNRSWATKNMVHFGKDRIKPLIETFPLVNYYTITSIACRIL